MTKLKIAATGLLAAAAHGFGRGRRDRIVASRSAPAPRFLRRPAPP